VVVGSNVPVGLEAEFVVAVVPPVSDVVPPVSDVVPEPSVVVVWDESVVVVVGLVSD
jgi:hypothetical protein